MEAVRTPGSFKGKRIKVSPEQEQAVRRLKTEGFKLTAPARLTGLSRTSI